MPILLAEICSQMYCLIMIMHFIGGATIDLPICAKDMGKLDTLAWLFKNIRALLSTSQSSEIEVLWHVWVLKSIKLQLFLLSPNASLLSKAFGSNLMDLRYIFIYATSLYLSKYSVLYWNMYASFLTTDPSIFIKIWKP